MNRYLALVLVCNLALVACGGPPAPTPDMVATQVGMERAVREMIALVSG